jgi:hypothetical protein
MRLVAAELALALLLTPLATLARGGGHPGRGGTSPGAAGKGGQGGVGSCPSGARSHSSGSSMQELDAERRDAFQRRNPCPSTGKTYGACPGYVARDVAPAKPGAAWSMRWMTPEEAQKAEEERF